MEASLASLQMLLRLAELADVEEVANLEMISFPTDEAATKATIRMRISEANDYFRVITDLNGTLIGFINGTCIVTDKIHHDSMTEHQPDGSILVIHSVTIAPEFRRRSIGSLMLKLYVQQISKQCKHINSILLLSKAYLLSFYTSCGFSVVGLSSVEHGAVSTLNRNILIS